MATVVETGQAKEDLRGILRYLRRHSRPAARRLAREVTERYAHLASFPRFGRARPELGVYVRSTVVGDYLIIYHTTDEVVTIIRILHGARNIEALMRETDWEPPGPP
jgi:toxin ParE1/3/4